jgi:hypothetical protein
MINERQSISSFVRPSKYNLAMDYFNIDPDIIRLPQEETRILLLEAEPYSDGCRVHIYLELTPFLQPPIIELNLTNHRGNNVGSASIVEPPGWKHELTMHIKNPEPAPADYQLTARLIYPDHGFQDQRLVIIHISEASAE